MTTWSQSQSAVDERNSVKKGGSMKNWLNVKVRGGFAAMAILLGLSGVAAAADKPNIVFIMGDDIGIWNIGAYHRGMMAGRTPNLDKLAKEGMLFSDYYAEASCTA